ncbi:PC4 and SFRS1-interacting protein-like isoform X2 [Battus philenor]|uniref:PC4 and SFRS1-interacting protein-like isoform X2 n=1 Tax=Battus philenor TaxID=42288 RepID=UPI0035CF4583
MKMGKKVREYKSGDFIFAKVKGYPAWPARVQRMNGKKYFVYFYGTGETANLPPNMIFDYAENKDKFLTKTVKRKDFNLGVKQIEYDFANNVPVEQVVAGLQLQEQTDLNDTGNESAVNNTLDETTTGEADTTANDSSMEDGRKSTAKVPSTPAKPVKEPKTPRGKAKKDEHREDDEEKKEEKKEEEIISRSGRKIRPKRYIDEQTEENATLPSPAPKKRRGVSPAIEKEKELEKDKEKTKSDVAPAKDKTEKYKHFNAVTQMELEDLKEPFSQEEADKENILIAYMPNGQYVGIRLFQSRPTSFKNESSRLQWDKQAATNAVTLKMQLERGQITAQSVIEQLVMDLQLSDEEKATLDKERETEEKKSRVQFLKTEMKLIELDAKIKTCLCLEKADTELCLKLLDELMELDVKPLMLLKHPTCLETVKRMRAYVGNTPSWDLSESAALLFSKQAHRIRRQADTLYKNMKELFTTPEGLSFWEYFSERVIQFKKITSKLNPDELLEMIHEPIEMSTPTSHTMKASVEAANEEEALEDENAAAAKKKAPIAKTKKTNGTSKPSLKRQSSRKQQQEEKEPTKTTDDNNTEETTKETEEQNKEVSAEEDKTTEEPIDNMAEESQDSAENNETENVDEITEKSPSPNVIEGDKSAQQSTEETADETPEEGKEKEKQDVDEPRAKRSRESKKTEPPTPQPRSPIKRKAKV